MEEQVLVKHMLRSRCRDLTADAIQVLRWIMNGQNEQLESEKVEIKDRIKAAELILAYGHGRPSMSIDVVQRERVKILPAKKPGELYEGEIVPIALEGNVNA